MSIRFFVAFACLAIPAAVQADPIKPIRATIQSRCMDCHNTKSKSGGHDFTSLLSKFDKQQQQATWIKIESVIKSGKMPPKDSARLTKKERTSFDRWFLSQFIKPGGVQHAGVNRPRRLTREELQNTLEDILHIKIRQTVTNSRLHVIPDTIIEKFFATGVIGESGFSNDATTLDKESINIQSYARCFSLVLNILDNDEQARRKLFGRELTGKIPMSDVQGMIRRFGSQAFRKPLTEEQLSAFTRVYTSLLKTRTPYESIKSSFLAILLSPRFLYRLEEPRQGQVPVVGHELAVRLSYFLWSAPPDQQLLDLAKQGKLRNPATLRKQIRRLLADPRRVALAENLGGEWFSYKKLRQQSSVNKRSDRMAGFYRTQFEEALLFFDSVIRYDQPIFSLVDADWAYINGHQRGIYRLNTGKKSFQTKSPLPAINIHYRDQARKIKVGGYEYKHLPLNLVKLNDPNVGGLVTLGPTMSVTSTPNRTSPIRRGVWVMERILGVHFEQPKDVPDLEETQKKAQSKRLNLSHAELLKLHSAGPGCSSCHKYIDPIGFGLEAFNQLGIPRKISNPVAGGEVLRWNPKQTPRKFADRSWKLKKTLQPGKTTRVFFQYTKGSHRLDIRNVRLTTGKVQLEDKHFGFTGHQKRNNVWTFKIPKNAPKKGWTLTASIQGNGGTNSHGKITMNGKDAPKVAYRLPNGKTFSSPAELKKRLLTDYRDQITDNAIRRVLAYALGRKIEPIDRPAIDQIRSEIAKKDFRLAALLEAVAVSYPFRHKEN